MTPCATASADAPQGPEGAGRRTLKTGYCESRDGNGFKLERNLSEPSDGRRVFESERNEHHVQTFAFKGGPRAAPLNGEFDPGSG